VNFNHREVLAICGEQVIPEAALETKIKRVIEVLDDSPVFTDKQMALAYWIADYYHCSIGKALTAMLPSVMQPDIGNEVKLMNETPSASPQYQELFEVLSDMKWHKLSDLRKQLAQQPVLKLTQIAEIDGLIEVKRSLRNRSKPRTVNFIELCECSVLPSLTNKQCDAYQIILSKKHAFPMAEITEDVSYAIIKALVTKGIIRIVPRKLDTKILHHSDDVKPKNIILNTEQNNAINSILSHSGTFDVNLLYGITGSGKTEVYIQVMKHYISMGQGVIFLIPEIALTPQMIERFYGVFGSNMAIMHSQLSERERYEQWKLLAEGKCQIVVGARSAVFVPIRNLGLIIVDEEHEQSYKQDSSPRYNGRDVAIVRAKLEHSQVILGSATPSLESWLNVQKEKYRIHTLNSRPLNYILPSVAIVNMCDEDTQDLFSSVLHAAIMDRLDRKEQVILFQNRRGYSSFVQCHKCGELLKCINCDISMYYHRDREELHCHYCGNNLPVPRKCPHCGSFTFSYGAPGTQKVEQLLHIHFPTAKILRLDSDSGAKKNIYKMMYNSMKNREIDILLGTQMISKGLDFPGVTLVGVINADISLNVPDFRASERTFQLLTQVAGRSGRGDMHGEVIIQTYNPSHYAIEHASKQDFRGFAVEELSYRKRLNYPPYYRLGRIVYQGLDQGVLSTKMDALGVLCSRLQQSFAEDEIIILGPSPAPNTKLNKYYRYHLIIKAKTPQILSTVIQFVSAKMPLSKGVSAAIDIDPIALM
jgi:primosomal protein N' (replication factor Y)